MTQTQRTHKTAETIRGAGTEVLSLPLEEAAPWLPEFGLPPCSPMRCSVCAV